jgi:hypothetical protein
MILSEQHQIGYGQFRGTDCIAHFVRHEVSERLGTADTVRQCHVEAVIVQDKGIAIALQMGTLALCELLRLPSGNVSLRQQCPVIIQLFDNPPFKVRQFAAGLPGRQCNKPGAVFAGQNGGSQRTKRKSCQALREQFKRGRQVSFGIGRF